MYEDDEDEADQGGEQGGADEVNNGSQCYHAVHLKQHVFDLGTLAIKDILIQINH